MSVCFAHAQTHTCARERKMLSANSRSAPTSSILQAKGVSLLSLVVFVSLRRVRARTWPHPLPLHARWTSLSTMARCRTGRLVPRCCRCCCTGEAGWGGRSGEARTAAEAGSCSEPCAPSACNRHRGRIKSCW